MSVKRTITVALAAVILLGFIGYGVADAVKTKDKLEFQDVQLNSKTTEIKDLNVKYERLNLELDKAAKEKNTSQEQLDKLNQEKQELEKQKKDLEAQLQAKLEQKNKIALAAQKVNNTGTATAYAASASIDCANQTTAKAFMYCHESGNDPTARNAGGCYGLGQDCNGILEARCGADYACQDAYFSNEYMPRRYGTWEKAKAHWLARVPINGKDVGNWW